MCIRDRDEPLDLSRRDARPTYNTTPTDDMHDEEQALNLSTRRYDEDVKMADVTAACSPAGSIVSVKSELSAPSTVDNDDVPDVQLDLLANGSLTDVSNTDMMKYFIYYLIYLIS